MVDITSDHPRRASLEARKKIADASKAGLLADSAMIAHGRGEAFDYLLGEKTSNPAKRAIREAAALLNGAKNPIISVNGNVVALASLEILRVAAAINCNIEVNLYYRTESRINGLCGILSDKKEALLCEDVPAIWSGSNKEWFSAVKNIRILGKDADEKIPNLNGPRAMVCSDGILNADVVLVPLEDGDRCEALETCGVRVLNIDLNPLSRSARYATITVVDEITRALPLLFEEIQKRPRKDQKWSNEKNLTQSLSVMLDMLK